MAENVQGSPSSESSLPQTNTQTTAQTESNVLSEEQNARRQHLEAIVANFREGGKSRVETYSDILRELEREPELTEEEKEATFRIISAEINLTEARAYRHRTLSKSKGKAITPQSNR